MTTFYNYLKRFSICACEGLCNEDCKKSYFNFYIHSKNDTDGYYSYIHALEFFKKFPDILNVLPNTMMTNQKIRQFLIDHYNIIYFDTTSFQDVWLDYFKWKLLYTNESIPGR